MRGYAYLEILSEFNDFGYDKYQEKWDDKLRDAEIIGTLEVLCSPVGGREQFRYGLVVEVCHADFIKPEARALWTQ